MGRDGGTSSGPRRWLVSMTLNLRSWGLRFLIYSNSSLETESFWKRALRVSLSMIDVPALQAAGSVVEAATTQLGQEGARRHEVPSLLVSLYSQSFPQNPSIAKMETGKHPAPTKIKVLPHRSRISGSCVAVATAAFDRPAHLSRCNSHLMSDDSLPWLS